MSGLTRLGRDSVIYGVLDAANRFIGIFLVPLYTRVLAPSDYGSLDLVTTFAAVAYTVFYLGLDSALSYYYNDDPDVASKRRAATTALVTWSGAVALGTLLLLGMRGPLAAVALPHVPDGQQLLVLAALALPLQAVGHVQLLVLRLRFGFRPYAVLSSGLLIATLGLNIYFVLVQRRGVEGILLAQLYARGALAIIGGVVTRADFLPSVKWSLALQMLRYGAPLVLPNVTLWLVTYLERYILVRLASLHAVGLFGVASRIASFVMLVSMAIDMAWVPFAHSIQHEPHAPRTYARALTWYLFASGLAGTLLAIFARDALVVLTQPQYYPAYILVGPIVGALVMRGVYNIMAISAFVTRQTRAVMGVSVLGAVVHVVLLLALIPLFGAIGAAFATLAARLIGAVMLYYRVNSLYPIPYDWSRLARMAAVFSAAIAISVPLSRLDTPAGIAAKALLVLPGMAAALYLSGAVDRAELGSLLLRARAVIPSESRVARMVLRACGVR